MAVSASSSTWWRTSASSSTSNPAPSRRARVGGWIRLGHPFPSVLDGVVTGAVAALAGGAPDVVGRSALAMTILQLAIGTVNDVVDAPRDAGRKPGKPIPAGLVPVAWATTAAIAGFPLGAVIAFSLSVPTGILAILVGLIGLAYDLGLKGTSWSWLPFAV